MTSSAARDWQRWGDENPLFGVLSDSKYLNANLTEEIREEFFQTGELHVSHVYNVIKSRVDPAFNAKRVLDYGCGVGRLVIPFAKRAQAVTGVDISPGMLAQARQNCERYGIQGIDLVEAQRLDSIPVGSFDLVHSFIVFQHIPVEQGEILFQRLMGFIAQGGVGAIHLTFSDTRSFARRTVLTLRTKSRLIHGIINKVQGHPFSWPLMQMNSYSMNRLFNMMIANHCSDLHVEFTDHSGFLGAMLYFKKLK